MQAEQIHISAPPPPHPPPPGPLPPQWSNVMAEGPPEPLPVSMLKHAGSIINRKSYPAENLNLYFANLSSLILCWTCFAQIRLFEEHKKIT